MATYRGGRPNRLGIKRDVQFIARTFPHTFIHVKRLSEEYNPHGESADHFTTIYKGDANVLPAGGTVEAYGMGTVENSDMTVLIVGKQDIRQGDIVTVNDGRQYEVQYPPSWFDAFMGIRLKQRSQIQHPTE